MTNKRPRKSKEERMEEAFQQWKLGKKNSLKELAKKYRLHAPDISRYITSKIKINKVKTI